MKTHLTITIKRTYEGYTGSVNCWMGKKLLWNLPTNIIHLGRTGWIAWNKAEQDVLKLKAGIEALKAIS